MASNHQLVSRTTIDNLTAELKTKLSSIDSAIASAATAATDAFKGAKLESNAIKLYTDKEMTGAAAVTIDLPVDMVLDQVNTKLDDNFTWSADTYKGSTNPNLEGKPVLVMAVKTGTDSINYSFLSMEKLVDTYTGKSTDKSISITISGYEIDVQVNVSKDDGNQLKLGTDGGLFVPAPEAVDLTDYAKKPSGGEGTAGNLVIVGDDGDLDEAEVNVADLLLTTDVQDYTAAELRAKLGLTDASGEDDDEEDGDEDDSKSGENGDT